MIAIRKDTQTGYWTIWYTSKIKGIRGPIDSRTTYTNLLNERGNLLRPYTLTAPSRCICQLIPTDTGQPDRLQNDRQKLWSARNVTHWVKFSLVTF